MRDIKFRGKVVGKGNWIYGNTLIQNQAGTAYISNDVAPSKMSDKYYEEVRAVGQYTGLKDENGREIYEGDIVKGIFKIKTGEEYSGRGRSRRSYNVYNDVEVFGIILYENGSYYFSSDFKSYYKTSFYRGIGRTSSDRKMNESVTTYWEVSDYLNKVANHIEIVGNIYDNKELLESEANDD